MTYPIKAAVGSFCLSVAICLSLAMGGAVMAQAPVPAPPAQSEWSKLPRMQLERQFAGPLQDTIVQRWRDPVDGMICYIYLPITAAHTAPTANGYVQYGANGIGTISCMEPSAVSNAAAQAKKPPAR
jgi:hypothetical protein